MRVNATHVRVSWILVDIQNPQPTFPRLHQPWGLTATPRARRFVLILDKHLANKSHASGKEAELERAENRKSASENAFSFSLPQKGNGT